MVIFFFKEKSLFFFKKKNIGFGNLEEEIGRKRRIDV